jgi:hypothetical protein
MVNCFLWDARAPVGSTLAARSRSENLYAGEALRHWLDNGRRPEPACRERGPAGRLVAMRSGF